MKGPSELLGGWKNLHSVFIVMAEQPACLFVHWSVCLCIPNQTLPGCTGTRKQRDPDVAAPPGLWERNLFGRGISFLDSVSAAPPESQGWEVGGKKIWKPTAVLVGASSVAPQREAWARVLFTILSPGRPMPTTLIEKSWGPRYFLPFWHKGPEFLSHLPRTWPLSTIGSKAQDTR